MTTIRGARMIWEDPDDELMPVGPQAYLAFADLAVGERFRLAYGKWYVLAHPERAPYIKRPGGVYETPTGGVECCPPGQAVARARGPYKVWIDDTGDHKYIECWSLAEAIERAGNVAQRNWRTVQVIGDGAEGGYGDDGSGWWDGLTDDEREQVEEAGLL